MGETKRGRPIKTRPSNEELRLFYRYCLAIAGGSTLKKFAEKEGMQESTLRAALDTIGNKYYGGSLQEGNRLTEIGRDLFELLRRPAAEYLPALKVIEDFEPEKFSNRIRTVRIAIPHFILSFPQSGDWFIEFREENKDKVRVEFVEYSGPRVPEQLGSGQVDLVVGLNPLPRQPDDLQGDPVQIGKTAIMFPWFAVCHPNHPLAKTCRKEKKPYVGLEDLRAFDLFTSPRTEFPWADDLLEEQVNLLPIDTVASALAFAQVGAGVSLVPSLWVFKELRRQGTLFYVPVDREKIPPVQLAFYPSSKNREFKPQEKKLREDIAKHLSKLPLPLDEAEPTPSDFPTEAAKYQDYTVLYYVSFDRSEYYGSQWFRSKLTWTKESLASAGTHFFLSGELLDLPFIVRKESIEAPEEPRKYSIEGKLFGERLLWLTGRWDATQAERESLIAESKATQEPVKLKDCIVAAFNYFDSKRQFFLGTWIGDDGKMRPTSAPLILTKEKPRLTIEELRDITRASTANFLPNADTQGWIDKAESNSDSTSALPPA